MNCRLCNNQLKEPFLSLGSMPLANSFISKEDLYKTEASYPLEVYVCDKCYLVQLREIEARGNIFTSDYAYFSSYSETWLKHCKDYTRMIINNLNLKKESFVVEIASNDGYLLQYFKQQGIPVLGIEPAANVARAAMAKGIATEMVFFNTAYARKMKDNGKSADLIIGNNVLAHNPNLNDFVEGLRIALKPAGLITMEFPHLLQIIENNQFDTIYHEHFSYFSFHTVRDLFISHGLVIFDVEEIFTHGGSLRIYAKHKKDKSKATKRGVKDLLKKEEESGLMDLNTYRRFLEKAELTKRRLLQFLLKAKKDGKKIIGYGAPAKGNTLLNYCRIGTNFLDYTVDRNPGKQNKYLPGSHIPVRHPDRIKEDKPDYVLILPWNIKDEIIEQMAFIREWGGKFVIPIPSLQVV